MEKLERIELQLAELQKELDKQGTLIEELVARQIPALCTIEQACKLKGGSDYTSIRRKFWQQPCCGTRFLRCNGRKVWRRQDVLEWLCVTDDTLEEYAQKMGVDISRFFKNGKTVGGIE